MKKALWLTWMRTLIVQGSWNYDRMVGVGVAFAMEPLLRDLPGGRTNGRYGGALKRMAGFFNAHPYLTGLAAGALARAEYDGVPEAQVDRLRNALIAPLGAVGDQLIWAAWLPLCVAVGLLVAAEATPLAGVVTFVLLYNVVHVVLRSWGLVVGWHAGTTVAGALGARVVKLGLRYGTRLATLALGIALPLVACWLMENFGRNERLGIAAIALLGALTARLIVPTAPGLRLGMAFVGTALLAGWLWP
jgi:PTS system mannose-specific IID component